MTSRTVHVTLKDKTLYTLMDLLQANKIPISGVPISRLVRIGLEALVDMSRIEYDKDFDFTSALDTRLGVVSLDIDTTDMQDALMRVTKDIETDTNQDEPIQNSDNVLRSEIVKRVNAMREAGAESEGGLNEAFIDGEELTRGGDNISFDKIERISFDKIKRIAPKDHLVEQCLEEDDNKEMKLALEIVYAQISPPNWGSDSASTLFKSVYNDILKYGSSLNE